MAPPALEARETDRRRGAAVHEAAADGAGPRIEILVAAPDSEVWRVAMQRERDIADRVSEIEADRAAVPPCRARELADVEPLAAQVLHAGQEDQRDTVALALEQRVEPLPVELERAAPGTELEQGVAGVEPVEPQLRLHGVAIGRERVALDQNLEAALGRAEEAHEHQMQVHGERVHRNDFVRLRTDELRERSAEAFVIVEPTGLGARERACASALAAR